MLWTKETSEDFFNFQKTIDSIQNSIAQDSPFTHILPGRLRVNTAKFADDHGAQTPDLLSLFPTQGDILKNLLRL